ncbi:hypothetical protein DSC45_12500 [Streptomyces sp. YIM 130001]|uniref:DUF4349 domain-containing protein n=1 Tax=Streptomyces sp. YIM 130001 TaxID=2259644 RepID=UPI000E64E023|nr:DUF4349 domain-containing protein [Streptomyces sp. YIM 130001]RII17714.1 hypothetical protein DSC45_12500 [Streptomyces sp. YIM 130001]
MDTHIRSTKPTSRRHRGSLAALLLAAALAMTACTADGDGSESAAGKADRPARSDPDTGGDASARRKGAGNSGADTARQAPDPAGTHIIRTAKLTVRVKDVPTALGTARAAADDAGGVVADESTDRDASGHERSRVTLRVPQDRYEDVTAELSGTGKLLTRKAVAKDVTDQVVDVESRVKSQRASVTRVRDLMDDATELDDVVTLEDELSTRQAELESLLARRASLEDRTALATITLTRSETSTPAKEQPDEGPGFADAVSGGWGAFVTVLHRVAVVLGAAFPFLALLALLLVLWRLLRSRLPGADRRRAPLPAAPDRASAPATGGSACTDSGETPKTS